jgi:aminotransferase
MMATMMTICNPGDKVAIFSPFYENYGADTILSGAEPIYVPLTPPAFTFDPEVLEDAFRQHPKALVLCNPSNPCGRVFTRDELQIIADLAKKYDTYVITDEVYEHIVFPPHVHTMAAALPGAYERVITCNSLSKTFSITGWRLGFVIAEPGVSEYIKKVHDFTTIGAPAPLQEAVCKAFTLGQDYYDDMLATYSRKRDIFCGGLAEIGLPHTVPQGSYFVMVDISAFLAKEKFAGWTDLQFCEWMVQEVGVAAVPGSSFFAEPVNHLIRLHFARSEESLREAVRRLGMLKKYL